MTKLRYEEFLQFIKKSFLGFIGESDVLALYESMTMLEVEPFQKLNREEPPQNLYLIFRGDIKLRSRSTQQEYGEGSVGQSLELKSLFMKFPQWQYDWTCDDHATLMRIPWQKMDPILAKYPERVSYLTKLIQSVSLQKMKRDLLALEISDALIFEIISKATLMPAKEALAQKKLASYIMNVAVGEVDVYELKGSRYQTLTELKAGDTFSFNSNQNKLLPSVEARLFVLGAESLNMQIFGPEFERLLESYQLGRGAKEKIEVLDFEVEDPVDIESSGTVIYKDLRVSDWKKRLRKSFFFQKNTLVATEEYRTHAYIMEILLKRFGSKAKLKDFELDLKEYYFDQTLNEFRRKLGKAGFDVSTNDVHHLAKQRMGFYIVHSYSGFHLLEVTEESRRSGIFQVHDTKNGIILDSTETDLQKKLKSKQCLFIKKFRSQFKPAPLEFGLRFFWSLVKDKKSEILISSFVTVLSYILSLGTPIATQYIMDQVIQFGKADKLPLLTLFLLVLTIYGVFIDWYGQRLTGYLTQVLSLRLKSFLNHSLFSQSNFQSYLHTNSVVITRFGEVDGVSQYFFSQYLPAIVQCFLLLATLVVIGIYSKMIALVLFLLMPISLLLLYGMRNKIIHVKLEYLRSKTNENLILTQLFTSLENLKALKLNLQSRWKIELIQSFIVKYNLKNAFLQSALQVIQLVKSELLRIVTFVLSLHLYSKDELSLGQVLALTMLAPRVSSLLQGLIGAYFQYFSVRTICEKLNEVIPWMSATEWDVNSEHQLSAVGFRRPRRVLEEFLVQSVSFGYDPHDMQAQLRDINLVFRRGQTTCITGPSGCGKSTLAYVMAGVYPASRGGVASVPTFPDRNRVVLIEQSSQLFAGSLLSNITLDDPNPDLKRVTEFLSILNIEEELIGRAGGLQMPIQAQGIGVSQSLKSKILVARALYQDPEVLILDEVTCYFDAITERQFINALKPLFSDRILIYITQRVSVASACEQVIFMKDGRVQEIGNHNQLLQKSGYYFATFFKHLNLT